MNFQTLRLFTLLILIFYQLHGVAQESTGTNEINYEPIDKELHDAIVSMDKEYFDAYNNCDMDIQAYLYAEELEFYHDKGGLTTSKQEVLEGIEKNICGKIKRTLIEGSIEVYPIKDFGAVEIGYHKFFNSQEPNAPSKPSKFIILWMQVDDTWKISKVISLH
ncbi:MAG: nuclear transport factor 2 family protein [Eudoraea sp.]|uniref:nuclear transport factor 2 family protein n=1 Tax=Eudoraea sp. TaxID=1979955 RepID=UPI00326428B4